MSEPLDLTLLKSFVAVVDCGNIQFAADRVGRSQSAVSMQIKRLEEMVGRPLFLKEGRSLRLNPAGEELLLHARRLLRLSNEALASLRGGEAVGAVRLGMPEDYATWLLAPAISRFGQEYPLVEVELTFDKSPKLLALMEKGKLDLALVTREPGQSFSVFRRERFVWAASLEHKAWLRDPLPVALFDSGDIARRITLEALRDADIPFRVVSSTQSLLGMVALAQAGMAVVGMVESCLTAGLVPLGEAEGLPPLPVLELSLVTGLGETTAITARLSEYLARELRGDGALALSV